MSVRRQVLLKDIPYNIPRKKKKEKKSWKQKNIYFINIKKVNIVRETG